MSEPTPPLGLFLGPWTRLRMGHRQRVGGRVLVGGAAGPDDPQGVGPRGGHAGAEGLRPFGWLRTSLAVPVSDATVTPAALSSTKSRPALSAVEGSALVVQACPEPSRRVRLAVTVPAAATVMVLLSCPLRATLPVSVSVLVAAAAVVAVGVGAAAARGLDGWSVLLKTWCWPISGLAAAPSRLSTTTSSVVERPGAGR